MIIYFRSRAVNSPHVRFVNLAKKKLCDCFTRWTIELLYRVVLVGSWSDHLGQHYRLHGRGGIK